MLAELASANEFRLSVTHRLNCAQGRLRALHSEWQKLEEHLKLLTKVIDQR